MILVTGGTGFIGSELVKRLATEDHPIRLLIRPSTSSPKIPRHVPVEIAVSSMGDEKGLKAAMKGVDTIIHLAGVERQGSHADLDGVDVAGTNSILQAVDPNRIKRFIYLSHIGADRSSAYPVMKAKAIAESAIQKSHVPYTIVRSAVVYGAGDQFTTVFTQLARKAPFFFFMPGNGSALLQPISVGDLVTCIVIALEEDKMVNRRIEVGGLEPFTFRQTIKIILAAAKIRRRIVPFSIPIMRSITLNLEQTIRMKPSAIYWLDYLATDHVCDPDSVPKQFGLIPARFENHWGISIPKDKCNYMAEKFLCIHGHFYQPPREDPLSGEIPDEEGTAPFRNWNDRIFANCYLPNTQLGNFQKISFDIWSDFVEMDVGETQFDLQANHRAGKQCFQIAGSQQWDGIALQSYNPAFGVPGGQTNTDFWGLKDFEHTFGHKADGMWLPETAADQETLELLAANGVKFTILAPWQAEGLRDPASPALIKTSNGNLAGFFYQKEISTAVSFNPKATENADTFARDVVMPLFQDKQTNQLMIIASDGELYGHHQPFRDLFLSHLINTSGNGNGFGISFPGKWFKEHPVWQTTRLIENTSWSCPHGVERWKGACGCTSNGGWKQPLRDALNEIGNSLNAVYFEAASKLMNPWQLRDQYIEVINRKTTLSGLLHSKFGLDLPQKEIDSLEILMAAQCERQRMFTSCGWFFEDFDRIEPQNNVRHAAQAVWLTKLASGIDLYQDAIVELAKVKSWGSGISGDAVFDSHYRKAEQMALDIR